MKNLLSRLLRPALEDKIENEEFLRAELSFYTSRTDDNLVGEMNAEKQSHAFFVKYLLNTLRISLEDKISLAQQTDMLKDYIECYRHAYSEQNQLYIRLNVEQEGDPMLPAFILFPLVQNALRYGYNSIESFPLKITIKIIANTLTMEVSNRVNHHIAAQQDSPEILNYKARLAVCYPDAHFLLFNSNSHTFKASLRIQL
ncbi:MAG: hypothetical protein ACTJHT_15410 [Sphingobacterium sp.]|uniref:hypothetical protein n=1 Tax=Sphingobacterium sp. JB170 TaxID=1434842 RepID=UPI00097F57E7|nr:hypothetical protein [Sphingobacterium sp. JB170]SJN27440.1 putative two-component system sensor protein, no kinase domain [Sphingobacterium sp. JB170]